MDLIFKPPEHHRLVHLFAVIDPFDDEMAKGIGDIGETPPGTSPLNSSPEMDGVLRLLEDIEQDKNRPVSQKKGCHKKGREELPQDTKDAGIGCSRQKEDDSRRSAEDLEKNEENKIDSKSRKKDKKDGKNERVEGEGKDFRRNPGYKKKRKEKRVKAKKSEKAFHRNDSQKNQAHSDHLASRGTPVEPTLSLDRRIIQIGELNHNVPPLNLSKSGLIR